MSLGLRSTRKTIVSADSAMARVYSDKIRNTLYFLENSEYPSLGPHLYLLSITGLWHPISLKTQTYKQILFYVSIAFFFSQYCKCLIKFNFESLKLILQYAPFHMGIAKSCFFRKNHKHWEELISYVAKIERHQLIKHDETINKSINTYIGQNRKITYFFWTLAFLSNFSIFSEPYIKNQIVENGTSVYLNIFDGYTPFGKEPPGYYVSMLIQTIIGYIISAYIVGWDTLVVSVMIFFAGQLKLARIYCRRLIVAGDKDRSHRNIAEFHEYYVTLIKFQRLFNKLIAPAMFIYLIVVSVNLGVQIIQIVELQSGSGAIITSIMFVVACLIQLLIFYWHGTEVTTESSKVSYAAFECDWVGMDRSIQREIVLIGITTSKRLIFDAGPFNDISLTTFVAILRTSYSFYTLMNGTK